MAATEEQRQWVSKVLGVDTGEAADPEFRPPDLRNRLSRGRPA